MAKCADCGFLALQNGADRSLKSADEYSRQSGLVNNPYSPHPVCAARACDISEGFTGFESATEKFVQIVQLERKCDKAYQWYPALNLKEHFDLMYAEAIRKEAEQRERELREWQAQQAELADQRHRADLVWREQQELVAASRFNTQKWQGTWQIIVTGIVATAVMAGASIFGSLIESGHVWPLPTPAKVTPQPVPEQPADRAFPATAPNP